ncbi:hypothetical protein F3Y22_tig00111151pilonHSYRG00050 [Hibiscus syriacus]|uniref:DUF7650 domain-containing protein n=1 Tax=Hibiscus syriacus TaxID=106335 RepID=A0A6A2YYV4_HIBSY|nr:hypothetical protein F3Y22_tig00111151pilonHSYRG00050 [Hibiscus syriacus]
MDTVQLDPNCNLAQEASPEPLLPPDSPDMTDAFGDPLLSPRVGDEYQVEIPPMITGSEHLWLLMDPLDSEDITYLAHSFLLGLPVPVTWTRGQDTDFEDEEKGGLSKLNDGSNLDKSVKSRKNRKGQISKRKKNSEQSAELSDAMMVDEKESNAENLECGMASKTSLFRPCEGKRSHLIPGLTDTADGQTARRNELEKMYMVEKSLRAGGSRNCYLGCSPLSLKNYKMICRSVGICALVEAVGLKKGKADSTGLTMEPPRTTQVSPEIPFGKACASLTCGDIIRFLTGGFRLSKARCNDIFWEAVYPRLLARGWHSEQPKNQCSIGSNHCLVFLMPGVKNSQEENLLREITTLILPCYLKPRVSILSSNHIKFSVVDSSLMHGGKASKMRELIYSPAYLMFISKPMQKNAQDSLKVNANRMLSKGDKHITNARHHKSKISSSTASHSKFTIVDSSLLHGGKSSRVRELRCLPVEFDICSKVVNSSGGDEDNSSDQDLLIHQDEKTNKSDDTSTEASEKSAALSIGLASPLKQQNLTVCAKRQRLNACDKTEQSCLTEKFSSATSEQMRLCSNGVLNTSHFHDKVSSVSSSSEGNPESMETPQGSSETLPPLSSISSSPPLLPLEAQNGEPGTMEANGSQFNIVNNHVDLLITARNVCAKEQQPIVNDQRQSKRSRPSTTRALEALESGFFDMRRPQKVRTGLAQATQFSSPSSKACSRVKTTPKHRLTCTKTEHTKEGKGVDGAFICSEGVMNNPPQVNI